MRSISARLSLLAILSAGALQPANAQNVTIGSDGWELKGDWVTPPTDAPWPAALLLNQAAGDRAPYRQLANALQENGIASLRLDLRGHGQSTNLGTFEPGEHDRDPIIWEAQEDVHAAHEWLKTQTTGPIAIVGASYSGEEAAEAGRRYGFADAYVLLSPGSLSEESIASIDPSEKPWLYVASKNERFLADITPAVQSQTTAEMLLKPGTTHAAHLLQQHPDLNERIVTWLAHHLQATCAFAPDTAIKEDPTYARHFEREGVEGTFVLYTPKTNTYQVHNRSRACERFIPASTFKIPNTLIALEAGVVTSVDETLPWDGQERWYDAWNQEHSIRSGFRVSAVWLYQELARRVGDTTMRRMLRAFDYGNASTQGGIDQFWLDGGLRISAIEQVQFLQRLHERQLPVSAETPVQFEDIAIESQSDAHILRAKTGWAVLDGPDIGWYVGYIEAGSQTHYFALNIDMDGQEQTRARRAIVHGILRETGLLPETDD